MLLTDMLSKGDRIQQRRPGYNNFIRMILQFNYGKRNDLVFRCNISEQGFYEQKLNNGADH